MIVQPDSGYILKLWDSCFTAAKNYDPQHFVGCVVASSILSVCLMKYTSDDIFIINGSHSVVYDGKSTWDLSLGIIFPNYRYPDPKPPKYLEISLFHRFFDEGLLNAYYSEESLTEARKRTSIIRISHGEENGTT